MSGLPLQPEEFFWEVSWSILWSRVWLTFAGVARGFGEGFLLGFSSVKTALLGGSIWFLGSRWRGRLNLSSSDQQMDDFQEILCRETWADKSVLGRVVKYFGFFLARGLSFWPRITSQLGSFGVKEVSDFNLWERDFQQGLCCVFSRGKSCISNVWDWEKFESEREKSCISNVWDWDCLQERFVCGMLILAEFSAGESNTLLFEHVQYVSYCMMAFRQKLRLLCQPGRACLNRSDQVSGFLLRVF